LLDLIDFAQDVLLRHPSRPEEPNEPAFLITQPTERAPHPRNLVLRERRLRTLSLDFGYYYLGIF
jgi:hypothetical protein